MQARNSPSPPPAVQEANQNIDDSNSTWQSETLYTCFLVIGYVLSIVNDVVNTIYSISLGKTLSATCSFGAKPISGLTSFFGDLSIVFLFFMFFQALAVLLFHFLYQRKLSKAWVRFVGQIAARNLPGDSDSLEQLHWAWYVLILFLVTSWHVTLYLLNFFLECDNENPWQKLLLMALCKFPFANFCVLLVKRLQRKLDTLKNKRLYFGYCNLDGLVIPKVLRLFMAQHDAPRETLEREGMV
jgi:hypothetical protein